MSLVADYDLLETEGQKVRRWRFDYAIGLGYGPIPAEVISGSSIDMHQLEDLLGAGCTLATALRILC